MFITHPISLAQLQAGVNYFHNWIDKRDPITLDRPARPVIIANHPAYANQLSPIVFNDGSVEQLFLMHNKHRQEAATEIKELIEAEETLVALLHFYPDDASVQNDLYQVASELHTLQSLLRQAYPHCPITKQPLVGETLILQPLYDFIEPFLGAAAYWIEQNPGDFGTLNNPQSPIVRDLAYLIHQVHPEAQAGYSPEAEAFQTNPLAYIAEKRLQDWQVTLLKRFGVYPEPPTPEPAPELEPVLMARSPSL